MVDGEGAGAGAGRIVSRKAKSQGLAKPSLAKVPFPVGNSYSKNRRTTGEKCVV